MRDKSGDVMAALNSKDAFKALTYIKNTSSITEKVEFLKVVGEYKFFQIVLLYAYSPFMQFKLKRAVVHKTGGQGVFTDDTLQLLLDMSLSVISGDAAYQAVREELERLDTSSQQLLVRILNKDLECGIGIKLINKAIPGLVPEMPYMRCSTVKEVPLNTIDWSAGVISQEKLDGMFADISIKNSDQEIFQVLSRQGQEFNSEYFKEIASNFMQHENFHYQGELLVMKKAKGGYDILPRKTGNGILNSILKGGMLGSEYTIKFICWDFVHDNEFHGTADANSPPSYYIGRWHALTENLKLWLPDTRVVYSKEEALQHFEDVIANGGEGTVLKLQDAIWENKTSKKQIKFKEVKDCELRVLGMNLGKASGRNANTFGSLLCVSEDGELVVNVAGFTDAERLEVYNNWKDWDGAIITVEYTARIQDKNGGLSLQEPRFVEKRLDKDTANYEKEIG
jgi:DNA ligase-1